MEETKESVSLNRPLESEKNAWIRLTSLEVISPTSDLTNENNKVKIYDHKDITADENCRESCVPSPRDADGERSPHKNNNLKRYTLLDE